MEKPVHKKPSRIRGLLSKLVLSGALLLILPAADSFALPVDSGMSEIAIVNDESGSRLLVDGRDFMVFGMNWGYMPIGENYSYDFWGHSDEFIKIALAKEMSLLKDMGVNVIRHYIGMPPRWVEYVYDTYGIWTVINHPMGRYGLTIDGAWTPVTDYSDPKVIEQLRGDIETLVEEFEGTRGMLMWLLGNENNYGLHWSSFEIEALPEEQRLDARATHLYRVFGNAIDQLHELDPHRPVAIANGDLGYIDIIAEECPNLDILGTNVYRGISARDLFEVTREKLGVPVMYTEFGADAFNAITLQEDQITQARYLLGQWQEIYEQSAGKGRVGNAIGGMTFQWSDGWWKFRQEERLDIHDTNASWPNAGYWEDYREGDNNMNEEWWGICAKGFPDTRGHYEVYPRAAYYTLRDACRLDPYGPDTDLAAIRAHFGGVEVMGAALAARGDAASFQANALSKVRVSGLRAELETFETGGENISTPPTELPQSGAPSYLGFDHGQSFFIDLEAKPSDAIIGTLSLNILGRVPRNPIDESFYENRGLPSVIVDGTGESVELESPERVKVYQASVSWDDRWFMLDAFYRVGHLHWQYQGDFFGLYRDAFYGENVDIYNGEAPIGLEIAGKRRLSGLTIAFGPQLWWGANPAFFAKYQRSLGQAHWTAIFQEEFAKQTQLTSSVAIPVRTTRKASLQVQTRLGPFDFEGGALWSGSPRVGDAFQLITDEAEAAGGSVAAEDIREDLVKDDDTFGFKGKLTLQRGRWNWYGQGAYMGLVAEGGPTAIPTFTGWGFRDTGSGNQVNALTGFAVTVGQWQIGPNVLWQKPIVGAMPNSADMAGTPGRPRNFRDDPFAVRSNRETTAAELMLTFDPTPATWLWAWDNDVREDADFAASFGFSVKRHHGGADAGLYISHTDEVWAFPGSTPARDLWEVRSRMIKRFGKSTRMISNVYFGTDEPNGDDARLIERFGVDTRVAWPSMALTGYVKVNDFGPYDYHRDFNLTYPLQLMGDLSYTMGKPRWFGLPQTRFGIRGTYRTLDRFSSRYSPEGVAPLEEGESYPEGLPDGNEWEIRTYLHLSI